MPHSARRLLVVLITAVALTGCGGPGSQADCGLDGCTVTFQRSGAAEVSVLGVSARLVGVDAGAATIEVAGQTVVVPVGDQASAGGFTVGVEDLTDSEVVVRISGGGGS
ncbi:MAG: hypothetical protein LH603_05905 [Pseudonocardia sp.]|nr:hypothetical protein [Pseudonocardia sp.]